MSFLYPRIISISRPTQSTGVGAVGYGGQLAATETAVASGVRASIQNKGQSSAQASGLPGDARVTIWRILFRLGNGTVANRDIIVDDLGIRYQVQAAYWNSLGYNCTCMLLES